MPQGLRAARALSRLFVVPRLWLATQIAARITTETQFRRPLAPVGGVGYATCPMIADPPKAWRAAPLECGGNDDALASARRVAAYGRSQSGVAAALCHRTPKGRLTAPRAIVLPGGYPSLVAREPSMA